VENIGKKELSPEVVLSNVAERRAGEYWHFRGCIGTLTEIFLIVLIGFAGLVIDVGHLFVVRSTLQNTADAASLAAAATLSYGPEEARNQA